MRQESGASPLEEGVSVVVPLYHAEGRVKLLVTRTAAVLDAMPVRHEFVFVDDGSEDRTWDEVRALAHAGAAVRGLRLSRNYGQHNALLAGVRLARCERIVTLDDDLQYVPESIPTLLAALDDGADLVYGVAAQRRQSGTRRLLTHVSRALLRLVTGEPLVARISAFRAFRTKLRETFAVFDSPDVSLDALLFWSTDRVADVQVPHEARTEGRSSYSARTLARHALTVMVGFSSRPLRIASVLGFACTLLGLGLLVDVLVRYVVEGDHVPGFAFLASAVLIFSGAQLFAIGIIGEYLARMYPRVMGRPAYSIAEEVGRDD
jgi:undecaprenyl-phosphate 4-deoxy-4-formamido-L-arabinose transferase